jgi:hypothetical protein
MSIAQPPPPSGSNWKLWGERLNKFFINTRNKLEYKDADSKATEDGILMWDPSQNTVVVSKNGAWVRIELDP